MGKVILPNTYVENIKFPLIFLAGPIRGAPDWQSKAIEILLAKNSNLFIASPRGRLKENIFQYIASGKQDYFPRQRAWERHYIDIASKKGGLMFWLPEQATDIGKKPYASMSRIELGEAIGRYREDNTTRFCAGCPGNFQDLDAIEDDLMAYAPRLIYDTLEKTCDEVLRLAKLG
jgi:hypothetical protein